MKILWNLLCQYNNINVTLHQYLKGKKKKTQTDYWKKINKMKHYCSYSALTVQKHWMYGDIYKRKKKVQTEYWKKEKKKDKVASQNGIVDEQWKTLYE